MVGAGEPRHAVSVLESFDESVKLAQAVAEGSDGAVISDAARRLGCRDEQVRFLAAEALSEVHRRFETGLGSRLFRTATLSWWTMARPPAPRPEQRCCPFVAAVRRVLLAVPVCSPGTVQELSRPADTVVCLALLPDSRAVGVYYDQFEQITDEEGLALLDGRDGTWNPRKAL